MVASRKSSHRGSEITLRHAWLAALGAFAVARREAVTAADIAMEETTSLRKRILAVAGDAGLIARGGAITLREKIEPVVARFSAEFEARIAPVLDKLGVPPNLVRTPRKARATKKSSNRRAAPRKVAERARARTNR
ncbi:MAG: hypothetical protein H7Y19_06860 [Luteimonas sp.]|nr:hypothetical protein [Luteimonas sp.]